MLKFFFALLISGWLALAQAAPAICPQGPDGPVHEQGFAQIGGIPQWITIDGARCSNPVILFLHGGPGNPLSPYAAALFAGWQRHFTLVQWDQRGAGKTYTRNGPQGSLSVERMRDDGLEVTQYVLARLHKSKVILWGSSWGSVLGLSMAAQRPELFHVYMGVAQIVGQRQNEAASYAATERQARAAGDQRALAVLEQMGPPPWRNPRHLGALRRITRQYEGSVTEAAPAAWWQAELPADYEEAEDYSWLAFIGLQCDGMFSRIDMERDVQRLSLPVMIVQGEADLVTLPAVTRRWFDALQASDKSYTLVERAGHDPNPVMLATQLQLLRSRQWQD